MDVQRTQRGLPLPSLWKVVVVVVTLAVAVVVWKDSRGQRDDAAPEVSDNPVQNLYSVGVFVQQGAAAVPAFVKALDSPDAMERSRAAFGLGWIGPEAAEALPQLRERLADPDSRVREKAAAAVSLIDSDKAGAAAAVAPLLADPQSDVRDAAGKALIQIGPSALALIREALRRDESAARLSAVRVLRQTRPSTLVPAGFGPPATPGGALPPVMAADNRIWSVVSSEVNQAIRGAVDDPNPAVRLEALVGVAERGLATTHELRELLRGSDPQNVDLALLIVPSHGAAAVEFLPDLMELLDDRTLEDPQNFPQSIRLQCLLPALSAMKAAASPAIGRLVEIAERRRDQRGLLIVQTLDTIGAGDAEIAAVLQPLLWSRNDATVWRAGEWLARHRPREARRQVSLLLPNLTSAAGVDKSVLYALLQLGAQAGEAIPALIPLLKNSDSRVVELAAHALAAVGAEAAAAVPDLERIVANPGLPVSQRGAAAKALGKFGPAAQGALPALLKVIDRAEPTGRVPIEPIVVANDSEWDLRVVIVRAVEKIGRDRADLIPSLRRQLASRSPNVRAAAVAALGRVATHSADVLPDLVERLNDEDPYTQAQAALAIGRLQGDRAAAVAPLTAMLGEASPELRTAAARALGQLGGAARPALPALRAALADPESSATLATNDSRGTRRFFWRGDPDDGRDLISNLSAATAAARQAIEEIESGDRPD